MFQIAPALVKMSVLPRNLDHTEAQGLLAKNTGHTQEIARQGSLGCPAISARSIRVDNYMMIITTYKSMYSNTILYIYIPMHKKGRIKLFGQLSQLWMPSQLMSHQHRSFCINIWSQTQLLGGKPTSELLVQCS